MYKYNDHEETEGSEMMKNRWSDLPLRVVLEDANLNKRSIYL